jgi:hypothetical protein
MLDFRRNVFWIIIGGGICLFVLIVWTSQARREGNAKPAPLVSKYTPSLSMRDGSDDYQDTGLVQSPDDHEETALVQNAGVPSKETDLEKKPISPLPPRDQAAVEIHQRVAAGLNGQIRAATRGLYGTVFQQLGLPLAAEDKVIDILTQHQKQLEQQAFEAAQAGTIPTPPSPEEIRAQQAQQNQQLRSVLGDAGFTQFAQYQATIPDRLIVDAVNQQGGNLSESQSQQLLQVLTEARQQTTGQPGIAEKLGSMSPGDTIAIMQQQQDLLQQTVSSRTQNLLTPGQAKVLQDVLTQHNIIPGGG